MFREGTVLIKCTYRRVGVLAPKVRDAVSVIDSGALGRVFLLERPRVIAPSLMSLPKTSAACKTDLGWLGLGVPMVSRSVTQ